MYFISSLILLHVCKVFPFRPTCGSYDSEIKKKKSQKEPKGTSKESEQSTSDPLFQSN
jgi:hypothetical protein